MVNRVDHQDLHFLHTHKKLLLSFWNVGLKGVDVGVKCYTVVQNLSQNPMRHTTYSSKYCQYFLVSVTRILQANTLELLNHLKRKI